LGQFVVAQRVSGEWSNDHSSARTTPSCRASKPAGQIGDRGAKAQIHRPSVQSISNSSSTTPISRVPTHRLAEPLPLAPLLALPTQVVLRLLLGRGPQLHGASAGLTGCSHRSSSDRRLVASRDRGGFRRSEEPPRRDRRHSPTTVSHCCGLYALLGYVCSTLDGLQLAFYVRQCRSRSPGSTARRCSPSRPRR
jgi:hypothetical protein